MQMAEGDGSDIAVNYLDFLYISYISEYYRLSTIEASNLEMPASTNRKKGTPSKVCPF